MKESEIDFLQALGIAKQKLNKLPDSMVLTGKDKIRLMLRSTLEPGITFGEWVTITISPQEFIKLSQTFQKIVEEATTK